MRDVVYAVVSGSYSDYSVHAVYLTRSDAEAAIAVANAAHPSRWSDRYEVEELFLLTDPPEPFHVYRMWSHQSQRNDSGGYVFVEDPGESSYVVVPWTGEKPKPPEVMIDDRDGIKTIDVTGSDQAKVRKVFYDMVAWVKAEEVGLS